MSTTSSFSDRPVTIRQTHDAYEIKGWQHHHATLTVARRASPSERDELIAMLGLDLAEARTFETTAHPGR